MLSFLLLLEVGLLSGVAGVQNTDYFIPDNTIYIEVGTEVQVHDIFFIGGTVETWQVPNDNEHFTPSFSPFHAVYTFNIGFRHNDIEIGWEHACNHPVKSGVEASTLRGGYDKFYIRSEVKF